MAITVPPIPPNTGNPANLEERADAFFGWFPTFVTDFNNDLPLLRGKTWAARGGTANAITLTAGLTSLDVGTQVRFRAAATNTGASSINLDGLGVRQCRTITGAVLPPGYIRTDVETVATYDGSNWIVDRQLERGANANGDFIRFADGTQICSLVIPEYSSPNQAAGSIYVSSEGPPWTFPAAFMTPPQTLGSVRSSASIWANTRPLSATQATARIFSSFSTSSLVIVDFAAIGRWY